MSVPRLVYSSRVIHCPNKEVAGKGVRDPVVLLDTCKMCVYFETTIPTGQCRVIDCGYKERGKDD